MIYLGFKFAPVPNWDVIMPINAPSNYKKQEAIDKYIAERKAKLAGGEAASDRLVGQVVQVAYKYDDEEKLYEGDTVLRLFNTLMEKNEQGVPIVGYKIHRALKLLALANAIHADALGKDSKIEVAHFRWIDEMYNKYKGFIDPVSLLFGTTDIDLNAVAMRCGVTVNADDPRNLDEFAQVMMRNVKLG